MNIEWYKGDNRKDVPKQVWGKYMWQHKEKDVKKGWKMQSWVEKKECVYWVS